MPNQITKPQYHKKGWGYELWIHNDERYCGKLLFFNQGKKCSFHYHEEKHETFYLQSGKMLLRVGFTDEYDYTQEFLLTPGDTYEIPVGLRHQMFALENSELFEFSTQHFEHDSIRVIPGD